MKGKMEPVARSRRTFMYLFLFLASFYYLTNAGGYKAGDESVISAQGSRLSTSPDKGH